MQLSAAAQRILSAAFSPPSKMLMQHIIPSIRRFGIKKKNPKHTRWHRKKDLGTEMKGKDRELNSSTEPEFNRGGEQMVWDRGELLSLVCVRENT